MSVQSLQIPRQRTHETTAPPPSTGETLNQHVWPIAGEWALLTVVRKERHPRIVHGHPTGETTVLSRVDILRGFVEKLAVRQPSEAKGGQEAITPQSFIAHLSQVRCIESDGEAVYDQLPDRIVTENSVGCTFEAHTLTAAEL